MKPWRILWALAFGVPLFCSTAWAAPQGKAVYTSKAKFRIPFKFDPAELKALGAKSIILYASTDQGVTWQQSQAVAPDAARFNFSATTDGEYWFVVRTLDSRNKLVPDGPVTEPELQVVVDTTRPELKLELSQPATGRVQLRWTAADDNLDATQLRLEYLQPGASGWQNVGIVPKASGQTEWSIPGGGQVSVRGSVADLARNLGQDEVQLNVGGKGGPAFDSRDKVANQRENLQAGNSLRAPQGSPGESGIPVRPANAHPSDSRFIPARASGDDDWNGTPVSNAARQRGDTSLTNQGYRVVSTCDFHINYELQDVGPSGISSVDLYMTSDNGESWSRYGEDSDVRSPVAVRVPREGTYGFAIVPLSGVGLSADPPQPGDKPQTVIVVDQTAPRVELLPLEQGRARNLNKILIQWRMEDDFPADKPISLSYAANPQGPWQPICGWTENTGRFVWSLGNNVPAKFYVRLEARDIAGNTEVAETPDPVLIDLSRPTARIVDVESQGRP